jgi:hypothetical protein
VVVVAGDEVVIGRVEVLPIVVVVVVVGVPAVVAVGAVAHAARTTMERPATTLMTFHHKPPHRLG